MFDDAFFHQNCLKPFNIYFCGAALANQPLKVLENMTLHSVRKYDFA